MICGIGTDIVSVARMLRKLENPGFKELVFSREEISYCESQARPAESYAGRFAAKEALLKAVGAGILENTQLHRIKILRTNEGPPEFEIHPGCGLTDMLRERNLWLSISHTAEFATAVVIIETL